MSAQFLKWFETFIEEKEIGSEEYIVEHNEIVHFIDTEMVCEIIKKCSNNEQKNIKNILVMLDFQNADLHDFFEHLAVGYIKTNYS